MIPNVSTSLRNASFSVERAGEEGGDQRIDRGEREQPVRGGDLQARPIGDRRRAQEHRHDGAREQESVR